MDWKPFGRWSTLRSLWLECHQEGIHFTCSANVDITPTSRRRCSKSMLLISTQCQPVWDPLIHTLQPFLFGAEPRSWDHDFKPLHPGWQTSHQSTKLLLFSSWSQERMVTTCQLPIPGQPALGGPAWGEGLDQMPRRGLVQPQPFCESLIQLLVVVNSNWLLVCAHLWIFRVTLCIWETSSLSQPLRFLSLQTCSETKHAVQFWISYSLAYFNRLVY